MLALPTWERGNKGNNERGRSNSKHNRSRSPDSDKKNGKEETNQGTTQETPTLGGRSPTFEDQRGEWM